MWDYSKFSDKQLWQYHQEGDIKAYNELFDRYANSLYIQASRWVKDHEDAEELVMDLFLKLWLKRSVLNPDAGLHLKSYLAKAMRNCVINHLQKTRLKTESLTDSSLIVASNSHGADYDTLSKEMQGVYETCLKSLSPQRLKVFKMSREEGLTYDQIAKKLNLSTNTVENYMVSALAILREKSKMAFTAISIIVLSIFFF